MIPYCDLKAQYRSIKPEIDQAVLRVLESAEFVLGSEVEAFEELVRPYGVRELARTGRIGLRRPSRNSNHPSERT